MKKMLDRLVSVFVAVAVAAMIVGGTAWCVVRNGWTGTVSWIGPDFVYVRVDQTSGSNRLPCRNPKSLAPGDRISVLEIAGHVVISKID